LPPGVEIVSGYDRSGLIHASISTLQRDLLEESIIVSVVIIVSCFTSFSVDRDSHLANRGADFFPADVLARSQFQHHVPCGLALAIGVLIDAAIVMVGDGHRHLAERQERDSTPVSNEERKDILIGAARQVGPAIFFSLLIIVVSFLPVFLLEAQEGRMFRPLAWTKTLAVGCSSILAITLVPVLMVLLIRGKLRAESANPVSRITQALYLPVLRFCLRHRMLTLVLKPRISRSDRPVAWGLGSQFMRRSTKAHRSTCPLRFQASLLNKRRRCCSRRTRRCAVSLRWSVYSAPPAVPTVRPIMRRSICSTLL